MALFGNWSLHLCPKTGLHPNRVDMTDQCVLVLMYILKIQDVFWYAPLRRNYVDNWIYRSWLYIIPQILYFEVFKMKWQLENVLSEKSWIGRNSMWKDALTTYLTEEALQAVLSVHEKQNFLLKWYQLVLCNQSFQWNAFISVNSS